MTTQLEYAPAQKWHQRRHFRRVAWFLVLIAIALSAWKFGPPIYEQCRMLYWQRQCMNHFEPPGMLPMIRSAPATTMPMEYVWYSQFLWDTRLPAAIWVMPTPPILSPRESFAFLHGRTSPAGRRLILAHFYQPLWSISYYYGPPKNVRVLAINVIEPGGLFSSPKVLSRTEFIFGDDETLALGDFRIDHDPADESAFTLQIMSNEIPGPIARTQTVNFRLTAADKIETTRSTLGDLYGRER